MPSLAHSSFYFADDKDISDLLEFSRRQLSDKVLADFLACRGIMTAHDEDREALVDYITTLPIDWADLSALIDKADTGSRSEKVMSVAVPTAADANQVRAAVEQVIASRSALRGEVYQIAARPDGGIELQVAYSEMDRSKNRLAQRRPREGALNITKHDDGEGYALRHEANARMEGIARDLLRALENVTSETIAPRIIELESVSSMDARTRFFVGLIEGLAGMSLVNVTWASVHRPDVSEDADDVPPDTDEADVNAGGAAMAGVVNEVILRGETLFTSAEYQQLRDRFYLSGVVWDSQEDGDDGQRVRFDAEFEDGAKCTGFKYHVRGVFPRAQKGEEEFRKTYRACTPPELERYLRTLEAAATASHRAVVDEHGHEGDR